MFFKPVFDLMEAIIKLDIDKILRRFVSNKAVQNFILDLNRKEQLFNKGVDSKNRTLGIYSNFTIEDKKSRGVPVPSDFHITLFDTGEFYSTFVVIPAKDFFTIDADPLRGDTDLFKEFGEDILGLTDESLQQLIDFFREFAPIAIRRELGLL